MPKEPAGSLATQVKARELGTASGTRAPTSSLQFRRTKRPSADASSKEVGKSSSLLRPVTVAVDVAKERPVASKLSPRCSAEQGGVGRTTLPSLIPPAPTLAGKPKAAGPGAGRASVITGLPTVTRGRIKLGGPNLSNHVAVSEIPACITSPSDLLVENPRLQRTPLAFLESDPNPPPVLQDPRVFRLAGERIVNIAIGRGQCMSGGIKRSLTETVRHAEQVEEMQTPLASQLTWQPEVEQLSSIIGPTPPPASIWPGSHEPLVSAATPATGGCSTADSITQFLLSDSPSAGQLVAGTGIKGAGQRQASTSDAHQFLPELCFVGAPVGAGRIITTPFVAGLSRTGPILTPDSALALMGGVQTPNMDAISLGGVGTPCAPPSGGGNPWEEVVDETPLAVGVQHSDITWWSPLPDSSPSPQAGSCRFLEMSPLPSTVIGGDSIDAPPTLGPGGMIICGQSADEALEVCYNKTGLLHCLLGFGQV